MDSDNPLNKNLEKKNKEIKIWIIPIRRKCYKNPNHSATMIIVHVLAQTFIHGLLVIYVYFITVNLINRKQNPSHKNNED